MHSPLCRQWGSTWAWTVRFLGIGFSTYLNTFHKANFYLCSSVQCEGWTEKHPARALKWVNNRTHTALHTHRFPLLASCPLSPAPTLTCLIQALVRLERWPRSCLLGTGLRGPISPAAAEPSQKSPQLGCPGLDASWASCPCRAFPQKKVKVPDLVQKEAYVRQAHGLWSSPPPFLHGDPDSPLIFPSFFGWLGSSFQGFQFPEVLFCYVLEVRGPHPERVS